MANVKIKIHYDEDWEEYQIQVWINGKLDKDKTCHTDDRDDAIETRHAMRLEANEHPERYQTHEEAQQYAHVGTIIVAHSNMKHFPGAEVIDRIDEYCEIKATALAAEQERSMLGDHNQHVVECYQYYESLEDEARAEWMCFGRYGRG